MTKDPSNDVDYLEELIRDRVFKNMKEYVSKSRVWEDVVTGKAFFILSETEDLIVEKVMDTINNVNHYLQTVVNY
jgi:hypothetical protein